MNFVQRIGGRDKLKAILHDFYNKMFDDIMVGFLFRNTDKNHIIDMQFEFLLKFFGETRAYSGKSPANAHTHLPILPGHFDRRIQILKETLNDHAIDPKDISEWIDKENSFRNIILKNSSHHFPKKDQP